MAYGIQPIPRSKVEGEAMQQEIVLRISNLHTNFYTNMRCNKVLKGVSLEVERGKTLCIVGESGCGKSVTAASVMRLLPDLARIESGEIVLYDEGREIHIEALDKYGKSMSDLRGSKIAMIFQDPMSALNPVYSIGFQIIEMIKRHTKISASRAKEKAVSLLREMGISSPETRIKDFPHQFSGGMRQRAMIAMAMSCEPKLLIADEPTTALDVTVQAQIFSLMEKLKKEHGTAVMMITHDMGVVAEMADDVVVMYMGYIVERGSVQQVLKNSTHPYTVGLMRSIPMIGKGKKQKLQPIRGCTADPYDTSPGCPFVTRCDFSIQLCHECMPEESTVSGNHTVRCHNPIQKGAVDART